MKKIYQKVLLSFMLTRFYAWIVMNVVPFIRFSVYYTTFRGWKYQRGYKLIKKGDLVLSVDTNKGTSAIISRATASKDGKDISRTLVHAGVIVDVNSEFELVEMTHHNYTRSCFYDFCKEAERVVIVRCEDFDEAYINNIFIPKVLSPEFQAASYNTDFNWYDEKNLYCSLLIYRADTERRMKIDIGDLIGLGMPYISPEGLHNMKNGKVIWDSDAEITPPGFY